MENQPAPKEQETLRPGTNPETNDSTTSRARSEKQEKVLGPDLTDSRFGVRDLFSWKSPAHQEWNFPREAFTTIGAIAILLSIILAFFQEWFLILLVWATVFLIYAISKVAPEEVEHRITNQGLIYLKRTYLWPELGPYWFSDRGNHRFLHIAYRNVFGQLVMIINKEDEERIRDILAIYLPFIEVWEKSTTEKITDWFSKKFSLEKMILGKAEKPVSPSPSAPDIG